MHKVPLSTDRSACSGGRGGGCPFKVQAIFKSSLFLPPLDILWSTLCMCSGSVGSVWHSSLYCTCAHPLGNPGSVANFSSLLWLSFRVPCLSSLSVCGFAQNNCYLRLMELLYFPVTEISTLNSNFISSKPPDSSKKLLFLRVGYALAQLPCWRGVLGDGSSPRQEY